jgi:hypothetical protein
MVRPDIKTHVVVIQPEFSEISGKPYWNIQGVSEVILRIRCRLKELTGGDSRIQYQAKKQGYTIHEYPKFRTAKVGCPKQGFKSRFSHS